MRRSLAAALVAVLAVQPAAAQIALGVRAPARGVQVAPAALPRFGAGSASSIDLNLDFDLDLKLDPMTPEWGQSRLRIGSDLALGPDGVLAPSAPELRLGEVKARESATARTELSRARELSAKAARQNTAAWSSFLGWDAARQDAAVAVEAAAPAPALAANRAAPDGPSPEDAARPAGLESPLDIARARTPVSARGQFWAFALTAGLSTATSSAFWYLVGSMGVPWLHALPVFLAGLPLSVASNGYLWASLAFMWAQRRKLKAEGSRATLAQMWAAPLSTEIPEYLKRFIEPNLKARRAGKGWLRAVLAQVPAGPRFYWDSTVASLRRVGSLFSILRKMMTNDPEVKPFVDRYRGKIRLATGLLIFDSMLALGGQFLVGMILDAAALKNVALMVWLSGGLLASVVVYFGVEYAHVLLAAQAGYDVVRDFRSHFFGRMIRMPLSFLMREKSGELANRIKDDIAYLEFKNVHIPISVPYYVVSLIATTGVMLWTHPMLTLIIFSFAPVLGVINGLFGERYEKVSKRYQDEKAEMNAQGTEILEHAYAVKSFANEGRETERFDETNRKLRDTGYEMAKLSAQWHVGLSSLMDLFTKYGPLILGAWFSVMMGLSIGQVTAMMLYAGYLSMSFSGLTSNYRSYKQYSGATQRVLSLLDERPDLEAPASGVRPERLEGRVAFEDVVFAYDRDAGPTILDGVTFSAEPGQMIAFVGETGSGKSSILRLIQRFWDPQAGRIAIDGVDLKDYDLEALNKQVALVPQDTALFSVSIRENMLYGNPEAGEGELMAAIRAAKADFVLDERRFPEGLDTLVGERGARLSGGERQRVAIVRAILRRPRLLLLDEATSALDNRSERLVQEGMDRLIRGEAGGGRPTTFVVAHRLSTIRDADQILFLEDGRIVERGTHAELMELDGRYARQYRRAASSN